MIQPCKTQITHSRLSTQIQQGSFGENPKKKGIVCFIRWKAENGAFSPESMRGKCGIKNCLLWIHFFGYRDFFGTANRSAQQQSAATKHKARRTPAGAVDWAIKTVGRERSGEGGTGERGAEGMPGAMARARGGWGRLGRCVGGPGSENIKFRSGTEKPEEKT